MQSKWNHSSYPSHGVLIGFCWPEVYFSFTSLGFGIFAMVTCLSIVASCFSCEGDLNQE